MLPYFQATKDSEKQVKMDAVRNVTVLFCGRCEREFLAKLREGQDNPTYECPRCKCPNRFRITWR